MQKYSTRGTHQDWTPVCTMHWRLPVLRWIVMRLASYHYETHYLIQIKYFREKEFHKQIRYIYRWWAVNAHTNSRLQGELIYRGLFYQHIEVKAKYPPFCVHLWYIWGTLNKKALDYVL